MQTYRVGGCVRDRLLGLPVKDQDWVVVGADVTTMLKAGFRPVGKDFPVFLHPETHEEYALARTERKTAPGYHGFHFHAAPDVTLEADLQRRDLTINAMAETDTGEIIDPYGGQADLQAGLLRHVSPAFAEDPVRVLRLARFAARFGFSVAEETSTLIQTMIEAGELHHLVAERVWQETAKALAEPNPSQFFMTLRDVGALPILFPEIDQLFGVPQDPKWHPEIDTGLHTMLVLDQAAQLSDKLSVRFAALCHDLGKGTTPSASLPAHPDHEARGIILTDALCQRLRVPNDLHQLARKVAEWHTHFHRLYELTATQILELLEQLDSFRRPSLFEDFLLVGEADFRGRPGYRDQPLKNNTFLMACFQAANAISAQAFVAQGLTGADIGKAIRQARITAIDALLNQQNNE
ncbi:multifunctional CCA addition/repair protein [Methylophaga frappieri]|nr:multifunctional CCA addition/repair protein [Methylophaga frappieri]